MPCHILVEEPVVRSRQTNVGTQDKVRLQGQSCLHRKWKRIGPRLVNLEKDNRVGILFSADSANAISYMPFNDRVSYMRVLGQMYSALYDLNVEPDFVQAGDANLSRYRVLLVPPFPSNQSKTC